MSYAEATLLCACIWRDVRPLCRVAFRVVMPGTPLVNEEHSGADLRVARKLSCGPVPPLASGVRVRDAPAVPSGSGRSRSSALGGDSDLQ